MSGAAEPEGPTVPIGAEPEGPPGGAGADPGGLTRAWSELGTAATAATAATAPGNAAGPAHGGITVDAIELRLVELTLEWPVATARGVHRRRPLVLVRVVGADGRGLVDGWGECAALADTTYDTEDVPSALATLEDTLVPALFSLDPGPGTGRTSDHSGRTSDHSGRTSAAGPARLPSMAELAAVSGAAPASPLAFAALEMAVADAHLRAGSRSLASLLGVAGSGPVATGAVVGRYRDVDRLVARVGELVGDGYTRVKLKIEPGWDVEPVRAVRKAFGGLTVQVDANESYSEGDPRSQRALAGLDGLGLACIEQPFPRADLESHARLAGRMATPICLDESLDSPARVKEALAMGACSVVCVKPGRLGGIGAALAVVDMCTRAGVPLWMGGMFESGYGRSVTVALAALPGFAWPGDTSPARSYLLEDLVAPPILVRTGPAGALGVVPADVPGMGPAPDPGVLDRLTTRLVRVAAGAHRPR